MSLTELERQNPLSGVNAKEIRAQSEKETFKTINPPDEICKHECQTDLLAKYKMRYSYAKALSS
jgi:hypothetical protein